MIAQSLTCVLERKANRGNGDAGSNPAATESISFTE